MMTVRGPTPTSIAFVARKSVVADLEKIGAWSRSKTTSSRSQVRPLQDRRRALISTSVRQDQTARREGHRRGGERRNRLRSGQLDQDLLRVDVQHPDWCVFAPALVGHRIPPGTAASVRNRGGARDSHRVPALRISQPHQAPTFSTPGLVADSGLLHLGCR